MFSIAPTGEWWARLRTVRFLYENQQRLSLILSPITRFYLLCLFLLWEERLHRCEAAAQFHYSCQTLCIAKNKNTKKKYVMRCGHWNRFPVTTMWREKWLWPNISHLNTMCFSIQCERDCLTRTYSFFSFPYSIRNVFSTSVRRHPSTNVKDLDLHDSM